MKHRTYDHINGVWHDKTMEYYEEMGFFADDIEWCVMEKIHGSNFAFYLTEKDILFATRGEFITGDKQFCNHLRMTEDIKHKIAHIWEDLWESGVDLRELIIYGEIFGGNYQHPDVEKIRGVKRVQKGVQYHPDIKFYAFDIWMKMGDSEGFFLDYDLAVDLFETNDIFYAEMLNRGTFAQLRHYPDKFQTLIPEYFDLPPIDGNVCEGFVFKPVIDLTTEGGDRVILKAKNQEALDKMRARKPRQEKNQKGIVELSHDIRLVIDSLTPYITETRLRNVLSKHVEFVKKDFNIIYKEFREEVFQDFEEANNDLTMFEDSEIKIINKEVGRLCIQIWRPIFLKEVI